MYLSYAHNSVFPVGRLNSLNFQNSANLIKSSKYEIRVSVKMLPVICVLSVEWLSATDDTTQHAFDCSICVFEFSNNHYLEPQNNSPSLPFFFRSQLLRLVD